LKKSQERLGEHDQGKKKVKLSEKHGDQPSAVYVTEVRCANEGTIAKGRGDLAVSEERGRE